MSDKHQILKALRSAKRGHIAWVGRADLLMKGYPVTDDQAPLSHAECNFGIWYLESSSALREFPAFTAIDAPHQQLHEAYRNIFKALFEEKNISMFQRLIGKGAAIEKKNEQIIKENKAKLDAASKQVLERLEEFEQQIVEMSDAEIAKLFT